VVKPLTICVCVSASVSVSVSVSMSMSVSVSVCLCLCLYVGGGLQYDVENKFILSAKFAWNFWYFTFSWFRYGVAMTSRLLKSI